MGRTKLNQDQIENLSEDLSGLQLNDTSLESKISIEDSINDAVDVSLDQRITYEDSINDAVDASIIAKVNSIESAIATGPGALYVETTNGTQVVGTTTATISRSYKIPGGRITKDCILDVRWGIIAQSNNTIQPKVYINTSNSLTGATQIMTGLNITTNGQTSNTWRIVMVDRAAEKFRIPQDGTSTISNWLGTAAATSPREYNVDLDNDIWILFANHHPSGGTSVVYFASIDIIET